MAAHTALGASGASRWLACPASVQASKGMERPTSEYAAQGQAAHWLADTWLAAGEDPADKLGTNWVSEEGIAVEIDQEMVDAVLLYAEFVRGESAGCDSEFIEQRVSLDLLWPGGPPAPVFGTADYMAVWEANERLLLVDFKYGKGVIVLAEDNAQMMFYALGALLALTRAGKKISWIDVAIFQPRSRDGDFVRKASVAAIDLWIWARETLIPGVEATLAERPPYRTGDHCRFCAVRPKCPALMELAKKTASMEFDDLPPDPSDLPPHMLALALDRASVIESWIAAVRAQASRRIEKGEKIPGWLLKAKRGIRRWVDDPDILTILANHTGLPAEALATVKPKTVAAVEKLMKAGGFDLPDALKPFVTKESSGTTLVPDHLTSGSFRPRPADEFFDEAVYDEEPKDDE